ncbi:hypothetical protein PM082_016121 [Marasmius tenuissimus]|nr:hypothetical protein PM082_016121 [Marasmius tenuissimus]
MTLPLIPLRLADIVLNTLLYGIFLTINTVYIWLLCSKIGKQYSRTRGVSRLLGQPLFLGAVALFATITAHWICNIIRLFQAFEEGTVPLEYYLDFSQKIYATKMALILASVFFGDIIIVYRLWVVWNRKYYVILLPSFSIIGLAVGASGMTYELTKYEKGDDIFSSTTWVICEGVFSMITNVYSTGLIAWRIWETNRHCSAYRLNHAASNSLMAATAVFVESALLYSSFLVVYLVTHIAQHGIQSLLADCLPSVAGISFGLINLRCHLSRASRAASQEVTLPAAPVINLNRGFGGSTSHGGEGDRDGLGGDLAYPMQPSLAIHIATDVQSSEGWMHSQLEQPKSAPDAQHQQMV